MKSHNKKIGITSAIVICLLTLLIVVGTLGNDIDRGKSSEYWCNRGIEYYESGMRQKAVEAFKLAIRIQPNSAEAHNNLATVLRDLGMYRDAIEAYQQAIRIKPDYTNAHFNLGTTYTDLDIHEKAIEEYKHVIQMQPDSVVAHFKLGINYLSLDNRNAALVEYNILKNLDPQKASELLSKIENKAKVR
jgi:tetratricopeptide (TPR) repeat protein